ncbi:unnamed protein product [Trifolium pratense]|uniref:Uncharacterized protein n=1 Tax=Trifolium pratense TaxID=57577 RepID=A0ACB0KP69_TRIPR|nr:unnamed protein product [Trifolium pratense]
MVLEESQLKTVVMQEGYMNSDSLQFFPFESCSVLHIQWVYFLFHITTQNSDYYVGYMNSAYSSP